MALTKAQWLEKIRTFIPSWWFEQPGYQEAVWTGVAAVFEQIQLDAEEHFRETFVLQATDPFLDSQGDERGVDRITDEPDSVYARRVQRLIAQADYVSIKAIVDSLLVNGECRIVEGYDAVWCDRECFADRDDYLTDYRYNAFTIITPPQTDQHEPYSFADREYAPDREDFVGTTTVTDDIYASIVAAVDQAKALGTLYRIVESRH